MYDKRGPESVGKIYFKVVEQIDNGKKKEKKKKGSFSHKVVQNKSQMLEI